MISTDSKPVAEQDPRWPLYLSVLLSAPFFLTLPRWPIGWDAIGFVLSARGVDLSLGRPHPPGYSLFALLGSLFHQLGVRDPSVVSQALGAFNVLALMVLVHAVLKATVLIGWRAHRVWVAPSQLFFVGLSVFLVPGWTQLATQCLPDLCALALLAQALVALQQRRVWLAGICIGLALANRPSDGVSVLVLTPLVGWLFLRSSCAFLRLVLGAAGAFAVSTAVLFAYHTPRAYWRLCTEHGRRHFLGEFAVDPRSIQSYLGSLSRWFVEDTSSLVRVSSLCVFAALSLAGVRALTGRRERVVAIMCVLWTGFVRASTQSHAHSRHDGLLALVLGALALCGLVELLNSVSGWSALSWGGGRRPVRPLIVAVGVVVIASYVTEWRSRRSSCGLAGSAVELAQTARFAGATMLFGLRNARAAELLGMQHFVAKNVGEMHNVAERLDVLPAYLYFTSELTVRETAGVERVRLFCDDTHLGWITDERDAQCLTLFRYSLRARR